MAEELLKKNKTKLYINTGTTAEPIWVRIGKSTIFDLTLNANITTNDFIMDEMPTDDVDYYKPTLPEEIQTNAGDPCYDYIFDMFYDLPTGADIKKDVLIVFAEPATATSYRSWLTGSSIIVKDLNTVDKKLMFDININSISRGTVVETEGVPVFTVAA